MGRTMQVLITVEAVDDADDDSVGGAIFQALHDAADAGLLGDDQVESIDNYDVFASR